jgi:hypothetical protein
MRGPSRVGRRPTAYLPRTTLKPAPRRTPRTPGTWPGGTARRWPAAGGGARAGERRDGESSPSPGSAIMGRAPHPEHQAQ